jgi:hypothetical protein
MPSRRFGFLLAALPPFAWACGGGSPSIDVSSSGGGSSSANATASGSGSSTGSSSATTTTGASSSGSGGGQASTPATAWTVSGVLQLKSYDPMTQLKLVATLDDASFSASSYAGAPVAVTLTGSPPSASFTLPIDTTKLAKPNGPGIISLVVFQDTNDNGVNDIGEAILTLRPMIGSAVWCNGTGCELGAYFQHANQGDSGTSSNGSYTIDVSGWYASKCSGFTCPWLVSSADMTLAGVSLSD